MTSPPSNSMAESSNFFLQPTTNSTSVDFTTAALIHPILQDVHTLRKLADAQNIDHFLNNSIPVSDDKTLSLMSNLANKISQALSEVVLRLEPDRHSSNNNQSSSKVQRGQKTIAFAPRSKSDNGSGDTKRCCVCGVTETPCWRGRTSGRPLCNFCGLVRSRRLMRKYLASARRGSHLSQSPSCST